MSVNYFWREKMPLFIILHLLTLLHANFVSVASMSTSFNQFIDFSRRHSPYLPASPAQAPVSKGPLSSHTGNTLHRYHYHRHRSRNPAPSPSPSTTPSCGQTCTEPHVLAPFGSPCGCVIPMRVRLLLGSSIYAIFLEVNELAIEIAAGTYLKQSQVSIIGASADDQNQDKAFVGINLIPLREKFDNTTATLTYQRFLQKKVPLNRNLFGDYEVMYVSYPGLPLSPPSGNLPGEGFATGNQQRPITADIDGKNQKLNPQIIFVFALSSFMLLAVCCATIAVILNFRKSYTPSSTVESVFASSMNKKRSGIESRLSGSPHSSTSTSLASSMPAFLLSVKTFSLAEIETATENFSRDKVLGEGGFGCVYHGIMDDGTEVAVKLLTRGNQNGDREFIAEIKMLSRLHHRNLVKFIGICIENQIRCLVYELVPNGSIESHLHGADRSKRPLGWDARLKIALGAARGLAYLHEDSNPHVVHRDFKASNILLENDFTPKVSDFGLAREATDISGHVSTTQVMGTFGYVAPEYAMTGHLLVKSDVYSYGVVLLELLSGRKPVDMSQPPGQENLVTWARPLLTNHEGLKQLIDPSLSGPHNFDDMAKIAAIASLCVHPEVTHRPFMGEVVQALKLIYNDVDETRGDGCSEEGSDFKVDFSPSDSSWLSVGCAAPYGRACMTMECSSCSLYGLKNTPRRDKRLVKSKRAFYERTGSMSEHPMALAEGAGMRSREHYASFWGSF